MYEERGVQSHDIADTCPFKNFDRRDMLLPYEAAKVRKTASHFQCKVCEKSFRSEEYLEKHLLRHTLHDKDRDICPSDLCLFMPCSHTDSDLVRARCEGIVLDCFEDQDFALEVVRKLCGKTFDLDGLWDWGLGLKISMGAFVGIFLLVYYMIVWGEYEEEHYKSKKE